MKEAGKDSSGKHPYISSPESVLSVVAQLTKLDREYILTSEKYDAAQAREIITLLLVDGLNASLAETGNFLCRLTAPTIKKHRKHGAQRLIQDEEFAHTFAIAERRSHIAFD